MAQLLSTIYRILKVKKHYFIFIVIATIFVIFWFKDGQQIAQAEEGFSLFTTINPIEAHWLWRDLGTGYPTPLFITRIPQATAIYGLSLLSIPMWIIQSVIFWLLITSGLIGFWKSLQVLFVSSEFQSNIRLFITLSYLFNLYTLSQIWGRFLYAAIFTWALLPWYIFLYIKFIESPKFIYLLYAGLLSVALSHAFAHPGYVISLISPLLVFSLSKAITSIKHRGSYDLKRVCLLSLVWIVFWSICNLWWIYPYAIMGSSIAATRELEEGSNLRSLLSVSSNYPPAEMLLLKSVNLFGQETYGGWYSNSLVQLASYMLLLFAIIGMVVSRQLKRYIFLILLICSGFFISHGTNSPLGHIFFSWVFKEMTFMQSLRNSFEKFGLVFVIPYIVFAGAGLQWVLAKIKDTKIKLYLYLICMLVMIGVIGKPFWTSEVFGAGVINTKVTPPPEYRYINELIKSEHSDRRILMTPMLAGDSLTLNWESGDYRGVSPGNEIFTNPVISKIIRTPYYDDKYWQLFNSIKFDDPKLFKQLAEQMYIGYIIVRKDIKYLSEAHNISDDYMHQFLSNITGISKKVSQGQLTLYQTTSSQLKSKLSLENCSASLTYSYQGLASYKAAVQNASEPCLLIFKETFSPMWHVYVNKQRLTAHQIIYDYANSWYITNTGNYEIELRFEL